MDLRPIDSFFLQHDENTNICLQFLRQHILSLDSNISEAWKWELPFFVYKGKNCCYLWIHKKYKQPYIGFVDGALIDHPALLKEKRSKMKILLIDPNEDLPMKIINYILQKMIKIRT